MAATPSFLSPDTVTGDRGAVRILHPTLLDVVRLHRQAVLDHVLIGQLTQAIHTRIIKQRLRRSFQRLAQHVQPQDRTGNKTSPSWLGCPPRTFSIQNPNHLTVAHLTRIRCHPSLGWWSSMLLAEFTTISSTGREGFRGSCSRVIELPPCSVLSSHFPRVDNPMLIPPGLDMYHRHR